MISSNCRLNKFSPQREIPARIYRLAGQLRGKAINESGRRVLASEFARIKVRHNARNKHLKRYALGDQEIKRREIEACLYTASFTVVECTRAQERGNK